MSETFAATEPTTDERTLSPIAGPCPDPEFCIDTMGACMSNCTSGPKAAITQEAGQIFDIREADNLSNDVLLPAIGRTSLESY